MNNDVIIHTVRRDETLAYIAYRYNTTIEKIVRLNKNIKHDLLYTGQKIRVK